MVPVAREARRRAAIRARVTGSVTGSTSGGAGGGLKGIAGRLSLSAVTKAGAPCSDRSALVDAVRHRRKGRCWAFQGVTEKSIGW